MLTVRDVLAGTCISACQARFFMGPFPALPCFWEPTQSTQQLQGPHQIGEYITLVFNLTSLVELIHQLSRAQRALGAPALPL